MASEERIWGTYVTDAPAQSYNIATKKVLVTAVGNAAKLGYAAGNADQEGIPNELRVRRVKCVDAAGHARWVPCYTDDATLWTTAGTTITLDYYGVDVEFTSTRFKRGEKRGRSATKAA